MKAPDIPGLLEEDVVSDLQLSDIQDMTSISR